MERNKMDGSAKKKINIRGGSGNQSLQQWKVGYVCTLDYQEEGFLSLPSLCPFSILKGPQTLQSKLGEEDEEI